jgi:NADH:ubiquinone oxidoreductase subunit 3 (subunit A)
MPANLLYLLLFALISFGLPAGVIGLATLIAPRKPDPLKNSIFESGAQAQGNAWIQFHAQYYIYGLAFLVFDVETALLYPWAVAYRQLTLFGVVEAVIFLLILLGGLYYVLKKGALNWE